MDTLGWPGALTLQSDGELTHKAFSIHNHDGLDNLRP